MCLSALRIDLTTVTNWNPQPPWETYTQQQCLAYVPVLHHALKSAPLDSLAALVIDFPSLTSIIQHEIIRTARESTRHILDGFQQMNKQQITEGAKMLAGLGNGLTPAGDDWLMGCTLAVWLSQNHYPHMLPLAQSAANTAAIQTTPLSSALLRAAAQGQCNERWHRLLQAMSKPKNKITVHESALNIIRMGHTSGADALTGFAMLLACQ